MVQWSDIVNWSHSPLSEAAGSLASRRKLLTTAAQNASNAANAVMSTGAAVSQMKQTLSGLNGNIDSYVNQVGELMMATAEAADGVWDVETRVLECQNYMAAHDYLTINNDGTVTVAHKPIPEGSDHTIAARTDKVSDENKQRDNEGKFLELMATNAVNKAILVDDTYSSRLTALQNGTFTCSETSASNTPGLLDQPDSSWSATEAGTWWDALTDNEKRDLIDHHPDWIGNLDGIDATSRDKANTKVLEKEFDAAKNKAELLIMQYDAKRAEGVSDGNNPYATEKVAAERKFNDLKAIKDQLTANSDQKLLVLDTSGPERPRAAIAIGDVDTADHVATFVPGMASGPTSMENYMGFAERLKNDAESQGQGSVAAVTWINYDPPAGLGQPTSEEVASTERAEAAVPGLQSFMEGNDASRVASGVAEADQTLLGHSYGSTVSGMAAATSKAGVVDNLVMFGSPGAGVQDIHEYNVPSGHAFVSAVDSQDAVQGAGPDSTFGVDPDNLPGIRHISNDTPGPQGPKNWLSPIGRHSSYMLPGSGAAADMARVTAGVTPEGESGASLARRSIEGAIFPVDDIGLWLINRLG